MGRQDAVGSVHVDQLVVASGQHIQRSNLRIKGMDTFNGRMLTSGRFRSGQEFHGQKVLIIGSQMAEDLALECWKFGAKNVFVSRWIWHEADSENKHDADPSEQGETKPNWPEGIESMAPLQELVEGKDSSDAVFGDGQYVKNIDAVIMCTGTDFIFPFIKTKGLKLEDDADVLFPGRLFKGVIHATNPDLMFIGLQCGWYTHSMQDMQALLAKDFIMDRYKVPPFEEMKVEMKVWSDKMAECVSESKEIAFHTEYMMDLNAQLKDPNEYVPASDSLDISKLLEQYLKHRKENIVTFRDQRFKSKVSGKTAAPVQTPWAECFDDSLQNYVGDLSHLARKPVEEVAVEEKDPEQKEAGQTEVDNAEKKGCDPVDEVE